MRIVRDKIPLAELRTLAEETFGDLVKAVVDVKRRIMAVGGELHADEETLLLEDDSSQQDLWCFNLYPELNGERWIEFDSVINIRPSQGNRSRNVDDLEVRRVILAIVGELVAR